MSYWPFNATTTRVLVLVGALMAIAILSLPAYNLAVVQAQETDEPIEIEYDENGTDPVAIFAAADPEGDKVFWSLTDEDAGMFSGMFSIDGGVLSFKSSPDYEALPVDEKTLTVMVRASDGGADWSTRTVMVDVMNVDEPGRVTLSSLQPQSGVTLTATLTDPDGGITDGAVEWQWAMSDRVAGEYTDLPAQETMEYRVTDSDVGMFLRATATYTDAEDAEAEKMAHLVSANPVWAARSDMQPPVFPVTPIVRSVPENSASGTPVGLPVTASDPTTNDVLTYTISGTNLSFDIDSATGQIRVAAGAMLDREATNPSGATHMVMVTATDTSNTMVDGSPVTKEVTINVTDVDEAPTVAGTGNATVYNYTENATTTVDTFTNDDPEDFETDWVLSGPDADKFEIDDDDGMLTFKDSPNYEEPMGGYSGNSNVYEVTVGASDGENTGTLAVSVKVMNADDAGEVTLSPSRPEIGMPVTATLTDEDGVSGVAWTWDRGNTSTNPADVIKDADESTYTPVSADGGLYLEAIARYTDGWEGTAETAMEVTDNPVRQDSTNRPPRFLNADDDVITATERSIAENSADADDMPVDIGAVVTATDGNANGTYALSGRDEATFDLNPTSGQITVDGGTELDHETKPTYSVVVTANNPGGLSTSITVTINVTDLDEVPELEGDDTPNYAENGVDPVETYTANDPEGGKVFWSLAGDAAGSFTITGGVLRFNTSPNHEAAASYAVTVRASDGGTVAEEIEVTVTVTDVEEQGVVTLSSRQPLSGTVLTATAPTDPDGATGEVTWKWETGRSRTGTFDVIDGENQIMYTPVDGDVGQYLQVTAIYTDPSDGTADDEAKAVTERPVGQTRANNTDPEFPTTTAIRSVPEDASAGVAAGLPIAATDNDAGEVLTYAISGTAAPFSIDWDTGQLRVAAGAMLNHEATPPSYPGIIITVTDAKAKTDMVTVTINVTDVDEAPTVAGTGNATVYNYTENATTTVDTFTNDDPEDFETDWVLSGPDADKFEIDDDDGMLTFKDSPNYEEPMGGSSGNSNVYEVTVGASDGENTGTLAVSVKVMNADDAGEVTLSPSRPEIGMPVTATLTDEDGVSGVAWTWERGNTSTNPADVIEDADESTYTPESADGGSYLEAIASYTDGWEGTAETAMEVTDNPVRQDSTNRPPRFLNADDDVITATERSVAENSAPAINVGTPVMATDPNQGDTANLTYMLSGPDKDSFDISATGQITVATGADLNHEEKPTYSVAVTATDPSGESSSVTVTINVTDMDEMPNLERVARGVTVTGINSVDYPENDIGAVATYSAMGSQAAGATWSLDGSER